MSRRRLGRYVVASALLATLAGGWLAGCPTHPPLEDVRLRLSLGAMVSGGAGTTRIVSAWLMPLGTTVLTLPPDLQFSAQGRDDQRAYVSDAQPALLGVSSARPLELRGVGDASLTISGGQGSSILLADTLGRGVHIQKIVVGFQVIEQGLTNLPEDISVTLTAEGADIAGMEVGVTGTLPHTLVTAQLKLEGGDSVFGRDSTEDGTSAVITDFGNSPMRGLTELRFTLTPERTT